MEDQQKPTNKIALNYGIYLGVISILIGVIRYALGMQYDHDMVFGILSFIIMIVLVVLGIKKYKEANGGFLTLGQGLKTGIAISLIGAVIGILYAIIFLTFIEPEFMATKFEMARQKMMENPNMTEEVIDQSIEMQKKFSSPGMIAAFGLLWNLFLGFVISLIASAIMQKKENEY